MNEQQANDLEQRLQESAKRVRFWKWLALAQLAAFAVVLMLGLAGGVRMAMLAAQQRDLALAAEAMAREQAEQARKALDKVKDGVK